MTDRSAVDFGLRLKRGFYKEEHMKESDRGNC